jgi:hypothetical protein
MQATETRPEFDSVLAPAFPKSYRSARNAADSAIYCHYNNQKQNYRWISSAKVCDFGRQGQLKRTPQ